jgi:hypothetical protein
MLSQSLSEKNLASIRTGVVCGKKGLGLCFLIVAGQIIGPGNIPRKPA